MASWVKLADVTNASAHHELLTGDWATPDNYRYLYVQFHVTGTNSDDAIAWVQFNGDTSSKYMYRYAANIATSMNSNSDNEDPAIEVDQGYMNDGAFIMMHIVNDKTTLKTLVSKCVKIGSGEGAGNTPSSREITGKWRNNTESIKSIRIFTNQSNGTKDYDAGSRLIVWGSDDTGTTTYPNLPNGALFEESDTGKIYMWDGTSAWNEMT